MVAEPIEVIIDRTKWLRGEGPRKSELLRPSDGKMCCLGSACLATGYDRGDILHKLEPWDLNVPPEWAKRGDDDDGASHDFIRDMMAINDKEELNDSEREAYLIGLAAKIGLKFVFIN